MKTSIFIPLLFITLLSFVLPIQGQVTIGSGNEPNKGALLDLKEENVTGVNSEKGLGLPRVKLTDPNNLYPMFETAPESGIANGNYNTDIKKGQQDKTHIGLVVYNTNRCAPFGHGVHVWDGIKWIGINALPLNEKFFDLFSGADARGAIVAQSLQINWTKGDVPTWTQAASSGYAAVSFETPLGPNPLVSSPTDMTIKPSGMTINPTNPWQSKQTEVTFLSSECGLKETVIFNQTNYALQVNNVFTNSAITAKTETGTIPVKGNVTWKASSSNTAVVNSSMSTGGVTKKDGTTGSVNYPYTLDAARKYQYADITFSDTETDRRFNDLKVSILNCHPSGVKGISVNGYSASGGVLDILSGHDERGTNLAQSITVNWLPADKDLLVSSAAGALANQLTFTTPLPSSLVASSPKVMNIAAAAMPTPSAANPWVSRETKVTFTDLCGDTYDLILNQTNYALKANESYNKTLKPYRSIYNNLPIESNGTWKVTATGTTGGQTTGAGGVNLKNGTYHRAVFDYTNFIPATNGGKGYKYDLTHLTFEDNVSPRRFKDITVSLINCRLDEDPTIQEWALKAGFTTTQISQVTQNAPSSIGAKNKVQLHRDQDNNLFLSGDFGTAGRWMLHNVRATKYDEVRTDGTMVISPNSIESLYTGSSLTTNYRDPHMGFPNDASTNPADPSFYNKTERIGRLYNWAAATMKKGSQSDAMGMTTFTEGETTANADHAKVQGICPRGWHLPSDKEWTVLEQEITNNTSVYSSWLSDVGGTITPGGGMRGTHGTSMKDICIAASSPVAQYDPQGQSNIVNPDSKPGFMFQLAGFAGTSVANPNPQGYATYGYAWTSSGDGNQYAWLRNFHYNASYVNRRTMNRNYMISVRCKQD